MLYLCPLRVNFCEMLDLKHQHKYKLTDEQTMVSKDINVSSATLSSFQFKGVASPSSFLSFLYEGIKKKNCLFKKHSFLLNALKDY